MLPFYTLGLKHHLSSMKRTREKTSKGKKRIETEATSCYFPAATEKEIGAVNSNLVISETCGSIRLKEEFFDTYCEDLARNLIGKVLVRKFDNRTLKARIVETESYLGGVDKASHSYNGKITERNKPMFMKPGTTYVYFTYGMYHCFNISSQGDGAAVLIRALEPIEGLNYMCLQRQQSRKRKNDGSVKMSLQNNNLKPHELCNGPGKLCISMNIDRHTCNMKDLSLWEGMWIEEDNESRKISESELFVKTHRIGIDSVGAEWAKKPLRYYLMGNKSVSRLDKQKELELRNMVVSSS
ncbi:uncharacterized protein LOC126457653 isoform X1 [Schistocerca serialis cubense]|uniref:uncharacterized protein LOC126457653 isoform X1 n=2 Tax=Schistocerca serialis cubense TaxID=2023355 RepID=UPI00214EF09F|nr:uncharacterized protein LOC126457653 isoform X1 [Schistocerca serialis cubense]